VGCLKNVLAGIGCMAIVAAAVAGFVYRDRLTHLYRRARGIPEPPPAVYVLPARDGAARAEAALSQLDRAGGPAYVDIALADLAALIDRELARSPQRVFDSVSVAVGNQRVLVKGSLDVSQLPKRLLGGLSENLGRYAPVVAGGRLAAGPDGRVRWTIEELRIGELRLPDTAVPAIIRSFDVTAGRDASVPIPLPTAVGALTVSASGVRLFRASPR
jgi:hypothetical protein